MSDPLSLIFAESEARMRTPVGRLAMDHVSSAIASFLRLQGEYPELESIAREAVISPLPGILKEAAEVRRAMLNDPAEPGLEGRYVFLQHELGSLAAFAIGSPLYTTLCGEIADMARVSTVAGPTWKMLRTTTPKLVAAPKPTLKQAAAPRPASMSASKKEPTPRAAPAPQPANRARPPPKPTPRQADDDDEYYL